MRYCFSLLIIILLSVSISEAKLPADMNQHIEKGKKVSELPEVVVVKKQKDYLLHIIAYVREYSTLTTYTDTIYLFREKMVDYMLPNHKKIKFDIWTIPRVLSSESYYRFTNNRGLDSVSNSCNYHFSWSDWMRLPSITQLPDVLQNKKVASDTVSGRYGIVETWTKDNGRVLLDINVIADTTARKWVPDFSGFFRNHIDFDKFQIHYDYDNITNKFLSPADLNSYSYDIESYGRGHGMFGFNHWSQPYYVCTNATAYIIEHEYLTVKEAKKWINIKKIGENALILEPSDAPPLDASVLNLISRVNHIDSVGIRIKDQPDIRLSSSHNLGVNPTLGQKILHILKDISGINQMEIDRKNYKEENRWKKHLKPKKERKKTNK